MERELIRKELAMYGILVGDDGKCTVLSNGSKIEMTLDEQSRKLSSNIAENIRFSRELWGELKEALRNKPIAVAGGNESTKRMFIECLKHLNRALMGSKISRALILQQLHRDINTFSESYMRNVVDYKLSLDWLQHLIRSDKYRKSLVKAFLKLGAEPKEVNAISGPWGRLDLPMKERVWQVREDDEDFREREMDRQTQPRYQMHDTYDNPYEFEEGFYYREIRNEPYAFDDEDNNPYPHRNLLWEP